MTWDVTYTNAGGSARHANLLTRDPNLERFSALDKPDRATIKVNADTPISKYADVDLIKRGSGSSRGGEVALRGLAVDVEDKNDGTQIVEIYSKEWLLKHRFTFYYTYTHDDATVGEILEDDLTGDYVGLLAMARSLLPPNLFTLYSGTTYKLTGGGTSSSLLGTSTPYHDTTALTLGSNQDSLTAGQYYRTAADLYVRLVGSVSPRYELVSISDWCDPGIRLGDISDISSDTFAAPYRLSTGRDIYKYLIDLLGAEGAYVRWRAEIDDTYLYLDAGLSSYGRGSSTSGILTFEHPRYDIYRIVPDDVELHGVIGVGAGDGKTTEMKSVIDTTASGNIVLDVYKDGYLYEEYLAEVITSIYNDRLIDECHEVTGPSEYLLKCGDYVDLKQYGFSTKTERVEEIDIDEDGSMKVYTGKRPRDLEDLYSSVNSMMSEQSSFAQSHLNMWTDSESGNVTNDVPFVWTPDFSDENGIIDTTFSDDTRVYLSFNLNWYKTDTTNIDTPSHSHSGNTNSGGSSVHGNTSIENNNHSHSVTGVTSAAWQGTTYSCYTTISVQADGSHGHSASSGLSGASHYHWVAAAPGYTETTSSHSHSVTVNNGGSHDHALMTSSITVAGSLHTHGVSGQTASGVQSNAHVTTDNPNHTLPMVEELLTPDDVDYFISEESTGSLKYLTVKISIDKGSGYIEISSSPYEDYYIGDSESGIDVTDYIALGGSNSIKAEISEYGGSGDVRCEISLSLSAQVVLTSI